MNINVGDKFYSNYFRKFGFVTRYIDDNNWWFKLEPKKILCFKIRYPETKAKARPEELVWVK